MSRGIRSLRDFLEYFPVVTRMGVHWGEMDAFQHVNNAAYLRYHETGRLSHFNVMVKQLDEENIQFGKDFLQGNNVGPILAETTVKYKFPMTFPESILIGTTIKQADINLNSMTQHYGVWALGVQRMASEGQGTLVAFDYNSNRKADQFPKCIRDAFATLSTKNSLHLLGSIEEECKRGTRND